MNAANLQQISELEVVEEVSDESFEQSAQPIDRSINSYTLEVENVLNSLRTRQQVNARKFDFLTMTPTDLAILAETTTSYSQLHQFPEIEQKPRHAFKNMKLAFTTTLS